MSAITPEKLYALLPAIHRIRDDAQGAPLRALLALAAKQGAVVEADIARLLDNWFIETCDEWVVPYIGDLLGVRGLHAVPATSAFSQRARVANTLGYRRRKGTATMLEQLARDTTGWPARAVEFFQILGWNQNPNHVRLGAVRTPDLRRTNELELLNTAFDSTTHTVDVRRIALDRGRHNLSNVGLFLWRLQSYPILGGTARALKKGFYTFNPLAEESPLRFSRPLFNSPQTEVEPDHLAEEIDVPAPLRRRPLYDELEARRATLLAGATPHGAYFGANAVLRVFRQDAAGAAFVEIPPEKIRICHLGGLPLPKGPAPFDESGNEIIIGVDPELGRLAWADLSLLPPNLPLYRKFPHALKVCYAYGFSGDLGGGPYNRNDSVGTVLPDTTKVTWQVGVLQEPDTGSGGHILPSLTQAIAEWHTKPAGTVGVIAVMDSHTYAEGNLAIKIPQGSQLFIVAADWPSMLQADGSHQRFDGQLDADGIRPHVRGNISITGITPVDGRAGGRLVLHGLLIEGALTVDDSDSCLASIEIVHSTLVPTASPKSSPIPPFQPSLAVTGLNAGFNLHLTRSICGPIALGPSQPALSLEDCIVDADTGVAIAAGENAVDVQNSSVLGAVNARHFDAGNSLFTRPVTVSRRQEGCVRFSYLPPGSETGRRYRCQPDLARDEAEAAAQDAGQSFGSAQETAVEARIEPIFSSSDYGHPAYLQLSAACAVELRTGAEDGAEMGAFRFLQQPQREANLRASLDEYLRFGLEAGLIFST